MSITDELREWASSNLSYKTRFDELVAIADRIDAEHERELRETGEDIVRDVRREWVRLPLDADGVPIHVGDVMDGNRGTVTCIRDAGHGWEIVTDHLYSYNPADLHHHHEPTIEDLLRELLYKAHIYDEREMELLPDLIAEYAAKLQLKEEE